MIPVIQSRRLLLIRVSNFRAGWNLLCKVITRLIQINATCLWIETLEQFAVAMLYFIFQPLGTAFLARSVNLLWTTWGWVSRSDFAKMLPSNVCLTVCAIREEMLPKLTNSQVSFFKTACGLLNCLCSTYLIWHLTRGKTLCSALSLVPSEPFIPSHENPNNSQITIRVALNLQLGGTHDIQGQCLLTNA